MHPRDDFLDIFLTSKARCFRSLLVFLFIEPFYEHHISECSRIFFQEDKRKYSKSQKRSFDWQLWVLRIQFAVQRIPTSMECEHFFKTFFETLFVLQNRIYVFVFFHVYKTNERKKCYETFFMYFYSSLQIVIFRKYKRKFLKRFHVYEMKKYVSKHFSVQVFV